MKTVTTLAEFCREVNIRQPKYPFFDIRKFEDKVKTENAKQEPFRHIFFAVALRHQGENKEVNGQLLQANLFFNSPHQVISWNVLPEWKGWYIMFGQDFIAMNPNWHRFIIDFPFFRLDTSIPFQLPSGEAQLADNLFLQIWDEYHSQKKDKFLFIQSYTQLLLLLTKRHFNTSAAGSDRENSKTADVLLISRFQSLIEISLAYNNTGLSLRQVSFYADRLHVHPNHLNAVVKRVTGKTALSIIQDQLIVNAKLLLLQNTFSVKEVAFKLHFKQSTHFNSFFKKRTGQTPQEYRSSISL